MINDGRCDCPDDGFDEPGTASCEKGRFYCKNMSNRMEYISSFKVNDGVCDCCDGSDEYLDLFSIKCPNTCAEASKSLKREAYLEKAKWKKVINNKFLNNCSLIHIFIFFLTYCIFIQIFIFIITFQKIAYLSKYFYLSIFRLRSTILLVNLLQLKLKTI